MKKIVLFSIFILLALLFDIGNPDALRQGTEGFYLQVASEMYERNSFLTPYYLGHPHWSKPPLLFLLPQLFYYFEGISSLFFSRVSVLILSLGLTFLAARKIKEITGVSSSGFLIFCFSTLGFFKYSRIFMMEMPLALFGLLSAVYFFSHLENSKNKDLILSIIFTAFCCLVKGPVAFAMLLPTFCAYGLFHYLVFKELYFLKITTWFVSSIILSSFWFLYEYYIFGEDFFNYFFLRENLGKFSSKSYPITHVFQGLFLYALPWSLLIPGLFWRIYKSGIEKLSSSNSKFIVFLLIAFSCFFAVWLIPQQRSHHYAIPAMPFILIGIYLEYFSSLSFGPILKKVFRTYIGFFSILGLVLVFITVSLINQFPEANYLSLCAGLILLITSMYLVFKRDSKPVYFSVASLGIIVVYWCLFIPNYILPLVPNEIRTISQETKNLGAVHRKPYFIAQSIGKSVDILGIDDVSKYLEKENSAVIIDGPLFLLLKNTSKYKILREWKVWRRGIKANEIVLNLREKSVDNLRSKMFLISLD